MRFVAAISVVSALTFAAACGSKTAPPPPPTNGKPVDPATAGTITGHVAFRGTPPPPETIRMNADPACMAVNGGKMQIDSALVSADGSLQNVFVYVKDNFDGYTFPIPTNSVVLDQRGCRYVPHVLGVRVGQTLEIVNDDDTLHNVHALPMENREFNQGQAMRGMRATTVFTVPEVMVKFKCDVHGWMSAWVGVVAHPFFAVTGADGSFTLKGVPPGTYTVEAWQEKFGTQTQQVTIGPSGSQAVTFTFGDSK